MLMEYSPISQLNSSKRNGKSECWSRGFGTTFPNINLMLSSGWKLSLWMKREIGFKLLLNIVIKKYRSELKEGEYLDVMNFEVLGNNGEYRGTTHSYKINLIYTTYAKTSEMIPNLSRFNLSRFPDILSLANVDDAFIDILGEIVGMGHITDINYAGNLTKLLDIQLQDLSETIIECALWEKHAEDVHSYAENNKTGPVILLGSLMRTKKFNGKISVQNSRFSTKIFLNEDIDEINEFKKE